MIRVTRLNGSWLYVNAELIRFVEFTPDTVLSLTDGMKIIVREAPEAIVNDVIAYRRKVHGSRLVNGEDS